jgi:hypothetical protein
MNMMKALLRSALVLVVGCGLLTPIAFAADADTTIPAIVQGGFSLWATRDASHAFDAWKLGGLLENDSKPGKMTVYFTRLDNTLGKYQSFELIESRHFGKSSRTIYLSINFERAAVYARFLLYQTDKGWVVQDMDFSPKPEALMPWLTFAGQDYSQ